MWEESYEYHRKRRQETSENVEDADRVSKIPRKSKTAVSSSSSLIDRDENKLEANDRESPVYSVLLKNCKAAGIPFSQKWRLRRPPKKGQLQYGDAHQQEREGRYWSWCQLCNNSKGMWAKHPTSKHKKGWNQAIKNSKHQASREDKPNGKQHFNSLDRYQPFPGGPSGTATKDSPPKHNSYKRRLSEPSKSHSKKANDYSYYGRPLAPNGLGNNVHLSTNAAPEIRLADRFNSLQSMPRRPLGTTATKPTSRRRSDPKATPNRTTNDLSSYQPPLGDNIIRPNKPPSLDVNGLGTTSKTNANAFHRLNHLLSSKSNSDSNVFVGLKNQSKKMGRSARALSSNNVTKQTRNQATSCPLKRVEKLRATPGYFVPNQGISKLNHPTLQKSTVGRPLIPSSPKRARYIPSTTLANDRTEPKSSVPSSINDVSRHHVPSRLRLDDNSKAHHFMNTSTRCVTEIDQESLRRVSNDISDSFCPSTKVYGYAKQNRFDAVVDETDTSDSFICTSPVINSTSIAAIDKELREVNEQSYTSNEPNSSRSTNNTSASDWSKTTTAIHSTAATDTIGARRIKLDDSSIDANMKCATNNTSDNSNIDLSKPAPPLRQNKDKEQNQPIIIEILSSSDEEEIDEIPITRTTDPLPIKKQSPIKHEQEFVIAEPLFSDMEENDDNYSSKNLPSSNIQKTQDKKPKQSPSEESSSSANGRNNGYPSKYATNSSSSLKESPGKQPNSLHIEESFYNHIGDNQTKNNGLSNESNRLLYDDFDVSNNEPKLAKQTVFESSDIVTGSMDSAPRRRRKIAGKTASFRASHNNEVFVLKEENVRRPHSPTIQEESSRDDSSSSDIVDVGSQKNIITESRIDKKSISGVRQSGLASILENLSANESLISHMPQSRSSANNEKDSRANPGSLPSSDIGLKNDIKLLQSNLSASTSTALVDKTIASTSRGDFSRRKSRNKMHLSDLDRTERDWLEAKLELSARDFLKGVGKFSSKKILSSSTEELSQKFKEWAEQNRISVPTPLAAVARWQGLAKTFKSERCDDSCICYSYGNSTDIPASMDEVPHLTRTVIGEEKLPIRYITVMNTNEVLFDFRVNVRPSKIPNSGNGAFMTFVGARKLKDEARKKSQKLMKERIIVESKTTHFLEASIGHMDVSVTLQGRDLHGNGNNAHFSNTRFPLKAIGVDGKEVSVFIGPDDVHDDIQGLRDRKEIKSIKNGIGHFKNFTEEDYEDDNTIKYCSEQHGSVDLGRYGPFSKTDRKTQQEFNLKNFIFNFESGAWNFGAAQKLRGVSQIIDVTDDCSGETHVLAEMNIPMYVNEVGHDKTLKQNVIAGDKDERVIHYYIHQRDPMSKGETVELLSNYGHGYERTRERVGYGLANINDCLESDKVECGRLKRDYVERASIQEMIQSMTLKEIQRYLKFLEDRIIEPLVCYTDVYYKNLILRSKGVSEDMLQWQIKPTNRQLLARLRLKWIGELLRKQMNCLRSVNPIASNQALIPDMFKILDRKRLDPIAAFGCKIFERQVELTDMYVTERYEEIILQISNKDGIFNAYDSSLWCQVARKLCKDVVRICIQEELQASLGHVRQREQRLAKAIFGVSRAAATAIRNSCCALSSSRSTQQEFTNALNSLGFIETDNSIITSHLQNLLPTDSKHHEVRLLCTGINPSRLDHLTALPSSLELLCLSMAPNTTDDKCRNQLSTLLRCITTEEEHGKLINKISAPNSGNVKVNEEWYLLWQVIRVVHTLALHCVDWKNPTDYSLENLCMAVDVDIKAAEYIIAVKMAQPYKERYAEFEEETADEAIEPLRSYFKEQTRKLTSNNRKRSDEIRKRVLPRPKILYEEKDGTLPEGWRVDYVMRYSGNHVDRYWYTKSGKKLRSRIEVYSFLNLIDKHGNEEKAWENFPSSRKKR